MTSSSTTVENHATRIQNEFYSKLADDHLQPLWTVMSDMVPAQPNPRAALCLWSFHNLRPHLITAGEVTSASEAERRVLMLVNPSMEAPYTTDTIYAGLQVILPGEVAPAHRHVAFALRFVIEGVEGFTAVEGQKIMMERGDVILTPKWHWHDHGNGGPSPMIWLDGLDLPLYKFLRNNFAEMYSEPRYPSSIARNSDFKFSWSPVEKRLKAMGKNHAVYHYRRSNGEHLSSTISGQAERISSGTTTAESQETCSFVYHVYEGYGHSTIQLAGYEDEQKVYWTQGDTFSIPSWSKISHTCDSRSSHAYLFAINDRPMVETLGSLRKA